VKIGKRRDLVSRTKYVEAIRKENDEGNDEALEKTGQELLPCTGSNKLPFKFDNEGYKNSEIRNAESDERGKRRRRKVEETFCLKRGQETSRGSNLI